MSKLFVSYSRANTDIVQAVVKELQDVNFTIWIDTRGILGGKQFSTEIAKAISECDFFLLFVSSSSVISDGVRREVDLALKKERVIIPILLEDVEIPLKWDYQVAGLQWIEHWKPNWLSRLLVALGDSTSEKDHTPSSDSAETRILGDNQKKSFDSSKLETTRLIKIFRGDFVNPSECDDVNQSLKYMVSTLSLKKKYLHLEFSIRQKASSLINQIEKFRKICRTGALQADNERQDIADKLEKLLEEIETVKNV